ncbi:unnamed protein product [Cladocopium goreaui]|uniref:Uncharacterized protein n=1 Tax=Cladocopium goreaui TaxID=2562237 RepID=A0A9P1BYY0_9DINO|nr:unnamed protein product [Cladocopium goreaui]
MASSESGLDEKQCPVVNAWMKLDLVVSRAAGGKIAEVGKKMDRQSVADNADVLEPLIQHFGTLAELFCKQGDPCTRPGIGVVMDVVARFLYLSRPRGKALPKRDTEDADDYESAESEAACSDDEPLDDDEEEKPVDPTDAKPPAPADLVPTDKSNSGTPGEVESPICTPPPRGRIDSPVMSGEKVVFHARRDFTYTEEVKELRRLKLLKQLQEEREQLAKLLEQKNKLNHREEVHDTLPLGDDEFSKLAAVEAEKTSPPPPTDGDKSADVLRTQYQRQQDGSTTQYLGTDADTKEAAKHEAKSSKKGTVTTPTDPNPKEATTLAKDPVEKLVETTDSMSPAEQNATVNAANPKKRKANQVAQSTDEEEETDWYPEHNLQGLEEEDNEDPAANGEEDVGFLPSSSSSRAPTHSTSKPSKAKTSKNPNCKNDTKDDKETEVDQEKPAATRKKRSHKKAASKRAASKSKEGFEDGRDTDAQKGKGSKDFRKQVSEPVKAESKGTPATKTKHSRKAKGKSKEVFADPPAAEKPKKSASKKRTSTHDKKPIRDEHDNAQAERKAQLSRKSCAYKKARAQARNEGKTEEEAVKAAKPMQPATEEFSQQER